MQIVYKPARRIYGKTKDKIQTQSKVPPIDFHAKTGLAVEYSISGNMKQASTQEYSITDIPPIDFRSDGNGISAYSIYGSMQQTGQPAPDAPIIPEETGDLVESGEHTGQYAIPITNAGTTTNIYTLEPLRKIGDYADVVGSTGVVTRRIKKLVLTGEETRWFKSSTYQGSFYNGTLVGGILGMDSPAFCTHATQTTLSNYSSGKFCFNGSPINLNLWLGESAWTTSDFTTYLADQYANGTPVCVWYVLQTPTTESITSHTITTVSGANTLSIGTTLQPSSVSLTTSSSVYPLNPIIPEEVGERTGNLFDKDATNTNNGYQQSAILFEDGTSASNGSYNTSEYISVIAEQQYTVSGMVTSNTKNASICFYNSQYEYISGTKYNNNTTITVTSPIGTSFARICYLKDHANSTMLNTGSTALPYEPYGKYKIPLNLNNTISNIYLSQPIRKIGNYSDSIDYENGTVTRQIIKTEITGDNLVGYEEYTGFVVVKTRIVDLKTAANKYNYLCSHFAVRTGGSDFTAGVLNNNHNNYYNMEFGLSTTITSLNDAKDWFNAQKTAGTPITIWYVLKTPQTESITPPTLTPSIESNTISVDTTLQPSNLSITYTSPDYSEIKLIYDNQGNILYNDPPYHDWGAVRWIVRQGLGPQYYPIGYIFYDNFNSSTGTAYQVVAHNHHFDPNLTALGYTYSMTCLEVKLNDYMVFDNAEAFLYTDTIIPAGTYRFTIPNYDATYGGNKTYYFTSTSDLPAGSQIVMNWPYNQTPKTVTAYSPSGTTMVQTITTATTGWSGLTLTEYVDGTSPTATDLGTIAGPTTQSGTSNYGQMNHIHRARYGSNNYLQSGIRQYLNSNSAANTWWQPQTIFDRPYGGRTFAGKLTKLNQNLVDVLATPTIQSRTNSYFETTSLDGTTFPLSTNYDITTDKLFLLSPMEVNFNTTDTTVGTVLDYYVDATNTDRIKIRTSTGAAGNWWLRTPYPSSAGVVRLVYTSGALYYTNAYNSYGCAPAWVIQ